MDWWNFGWARSIQGHLAEIRPLSLSRGREEQAGPGRGFFSLAAQPSPAQRSSRLNRLVCHAITTTITYHLLVAHPSNMRASQVQFSGMPTGKTYVSVS